MEEQADIPWDALRYVTGQINYGGRVTDDWDRRCLTCILRIFYNVQIVQEQYAFSASGTYHAPEDLSFAGLENYMKSLPTADNPEAFGMHENANVSP